MLCPNCGLNLTAQAALCPACGHIIMRLSEPGPVSAKDRRTATLLCFFLGLFGAHRFYVGRTGTGLLQLVTLGCLGVWTFIDFLNLVRGRFIDAEGKLLN